MSHRRGTNGRGASAAAAGGRAGVLLLLLASCQALAPVLPNPPPRWKPRRDAGREDFDPSRSVLGRTVRDVGRAPVAFGHDVLTAAKDTRTWVPLAATGLVAAVVKNSGFDAEDYFQDRDVLPHGVSRAADELGDGAWLLGGTAAWYLGSQVLESYEGYEASKVMFRSLGATGLVTLGVKALNLSTRPDGSDPYGFPSGHAAMSMAAATTLFDLYGWKAGVPAFLASGVIGVQRLDSRRHDLGDVLFGWALGFGIARSITRDRLPKVLGLEVELRFLPELGGLGLSFHNGSR